MKILQIGVIAIALISLCQSVRVKGAGGKNFAQKKSNKLLNKLLGNIKDLSVVINVTIKEADGSESSENIWSSSYNDGDS